jgi:hypothetical protein
MRFALRTSLVVAAALAFAEGVSAQPAALEVVPASIDFGVVERGAKVVSTADAFLGPGSAEGKRFTVEPPEFVTIRSAGVTTFGPTLRFRMEFSVNTAETGVKDGAIGVILDNLSFQIPVRIEVVQPREGSVGTLLLDSPFRNGATPAGIDAWHDLVVRANLSPHYVTHQEGPCLGGIDLGRYRSVLINNTGSVHLSAREVGDLREFVRDGGRLVLFAGPESAGERFPMHDLVESFGLKALQEQVTPKLFSVAAKSLPDDPMFAGVGELRFQGHYPISITDSDSARVVLSYPNRPEAAVVAQAKLGDGDVIAIAQHHWPVWFGEGPDRKFVGADNALLLENLLGLRDRSE